MKLTYIQTNLKRYTFESPKIKQWVEKAATGKTLNIFAGKTKLNVDEIRNDIDKTMVADYHEDALDFVKKYGVSEFNTIILDPPYAYRKAMEMYNGNYSSRFKQLADQLIGVKRIISFGYHSTFMGKKRGYGVEELCVFGHGGAQHCTIGIVEIFMESKR